MRLAVKVPSHWLHATGLLGASWQLIACSHCGPVPLAQAPAPAPIACPAGSAPASDGRCVPEAWHCSPLYYAAGAQDGCDCDCGAPDPDCESKTASTFCYNAGQPQQVDGCNQCSLQATAGP